MLVRINHSTIENESFYNLCRIASVTGYANPIAAFKSLGLSVSVIKDDLGNIASVLGFN